jgi:hypothetical protein
MRLMRSSLVGCVRSSCLFRLSRCNPMQPRMARAPSKNSLNAKPYRTPQRVSAHSPLRTWTGPIDSSRSQLELNSSRQRYVPSVPGDIRGRGRRQPRASLSPFPRRRVRQVTFFLRASIVATGTDTNSDALLPPHAWVARAFCCISLFSLPLRVPHDALLHTQLSPTIGPRLLPLDSCRSLPQYRTICLRRLPVLDWSSFSRFCCATSPPPHANRPLLHLNFFSCKVGCAAVPSVHTSSRGPN